MPDDWKMTLFGCFIPGEKDFKEFRAIVSPVQSLIVDEGFGVRFHILKDQILIAVTPNKDGTRPQIAAAVPLEEGDVEVIKLEASPEELKGFSLNDKSCTPIHIAAKKYFQELSADKQALSADKMDALWDIETQRHWKQPAGGNVPNPTTGLRGLLRRVFE